MSSKMKNLDKLNLSDLKITELKTELKKRNMSQVGKKRVLVERLKCVIKPDCLLHEISEQGDNSSFSSNQSKDGSFITIQDSDKVKGRITTTLTLLNKINLLESQLNFLKIQNTKLRNFNNRNAAKVNSSCNMTSKTKLFCKESKNEKGDSDSKEENIVKERAKPINIAETKVIFNDDRKEEVNVQDNPIKVTANVSSIIVNNPPLIKTNSINNTKINKHKILILGDSHARDLGSMLLSRVDNHSFNVCSIFKPNAMFESVVADTDKLLSTYGKHDFVVVIGGSNNAIQRRHIEKSALEKLDHFANLTNVIVISAPYWKNRHVLNRFVAEANAYIYNNLVSKNRNIRYIDINQVINPELFTHHGLHLRKSGKMILVKNIINAIKSFKKYNTAFNHINFKNLIYVDQIIIAKPLQQLSVLSESSDPNFSESVAELRVQNDQATGDNLFHHISIISDESDDIGIDKEDF